MAEVELESVLEFLRKNGLSESESALTEDIIEKSQLASSEFEKFFFPMAPAPPSLRIPELREGGGESSKSLSDDEFVSPAGSSTTELCCSEFTNPYGIRPSSQSSSDRLSQFGTARDYLDFDMQNDLFWYKEKDEDFYAEDKYITTVEKENSKHKASKDYYELGQLFVLERNKQKHEQVFSDYTCSATLCACCDKGTQVYTDRAQYNLVGMKTEDVNENCVSPNGLHDWVGGKFDDMDEFCADKKSDEKNENENHEFVYDEVIAGESNEPQVVLNEEDGVSMCDSKEDDFDIFSLRIIHRKNRTGFEENKDFPIVMNSIIAGRYYVTEFLGSAAFSKVVQAHDLCLGLDVCLKIIKNDKDFFDQSLDEIKLLKFVNKHDPADESHILRLYDYFYCQKYNQESGGEPYFTLHRLQIITQQCLEALTYLHDLGIIHCDLKPENILIKSYRRCEIKVIDLGSSCFQTDNLSLYVQSRSYRAPEVMLGLPYDQKIDLWSLGCILAELCTGEVLFPNEAIVTILARMIGVLGPIDMEMLQQGQETHKYFTKEYDLYYINEDTNKLEYIVPDETSLEHHLDVSDSCFIEFLKCLLEINPKRRLTAREALQHPWLSYSYEAHYISSLSSSPTRRTQCSSIALRHTPESAKPYSALDDSSSQSSRTPSVSSPPKSLVRDAPQATQIKSLVRAAPQAQSRVSVEQIRQNPI
ncbi:Protein kinase superfamily protein [Striga hermonthica]|uniref:Protein kinase superfamily protein n=1 Tax=Striga hermonthica TaxID=68872 RepID=A0A9N7RA83_STRHE|nr:Protein kinase superfamily protein [Striga hermonthica]